MVCVAKGYQFSCVSDPNISPQTSRLIKAYGAELIIVNMSFLNISETVLHRMRSKRF
jgi:cysteine synthase